MKHLRIFDSVQEMNTFAQSSEIDFMGLAYENGEPVMLNKVIPQTPTNSNTTDGHDANQSNE